MLFAQVLTMLLMIEKNSGYVKMNAVCFRVEICCMLEYSLLESNLCVVLFILFRLKIKLTIPKYIVNNLLSFC
jgi:hypothetical protein